MNSKYAIIILILSGCSVNVLQRAKTPCIDELKEEGVHSFRCKSICPTTTLSTNASIITGAYPNIHGIIGDNFYDRKSKQIIDLNTEAVDKYLLSKTLFEEVNGLKACIATSITLGANIIIPKPEVQAKELFNQDIYILKKSMKILEQYKPLIIVINLLGIENIGKFHGPLSREVINHIENIDELICSLKKLVEKIYNDYLFIILANHGMSPIRKNVDLREILEGLNVIICTSHRIAHIYTINNEITEVINRLRSDNRFELIIYGKDLAKYHLNNPRSGDVIVIAKEGYELSSKKLKGSYGGISPNEIFVPLIINKPEYIDVIKHSDLTIIPKIVFRYLREIRAIDIAKEKLRHTDPAHGWDHTFRVLHLATKLAIKYGADIEAVRISSIFHDVGRDKESKNHQVKSAELAEKYLEEMKSSKNLINKVKNIILKHHEDPNKLVSLEEKILWDSDKLDAIRLIGLVRCFIEAGFYRRSLNDAIDHTLRDVYKFGNKMHFKETKEMAKLRISHELEFIDKLRKELTSILSLKNNAN